MHPQDREAIGPTRRPLTSIIILTLNELACTRLCLESLAAHTPEPHEVIVVDNGSHDGTVDFLRRVRGVRLIANRQNRGFAGGCNQGMVAARGDLLLLLNNDCVVTPGWLAGLGRVLDSRPRAGMAGPVSNYVSGPQLDREARYSTMEEMLRHAAATAARERGRATSVGRLVGLCLLFPRSLMERIGLLDERFGRGNFEDDDYCRRALIAGYELLIAHEVFIHHFGSRTFQANQIDYLAEHERNRAVYRAKWNDLPAPRPLPAEAGDPLAAGWQPA